MELTGKCKEDFEKWYSLFIKKEGFSPRNNMNEELDLFDEFPDSMIFSVLVDFFDSVGIEINIKHIVNPRWMYIISDPSRYGFHLNDYLKNINCETLPESRTKAIEKAVEIYNSNNQ